MDTPAAIGIKRLSSSGRGRTSINNPAAAPIAAVIGSTNNNAPRKAKTRPIIDPSMLLPLLNGIFLLPNLLPNNEAELSPSASTAIAAYPILVGNMSKESAIPNAWNIGEVLNSWSSDLSAAQIGNLRDYRHFSAKDPEQLRGGVDEHCNE